MSRRVGGVRARYTELKRKTTLQRAVLKGHYTRMKKRLETLKVVIRAIEVELAHLR